MFIIVVHHLLLPSLNKDLLTYLLSIGQKITLKTKIAKIPRMLMKTARISNFNPLMQMMSPFVRMGNCFTDVTIVIIALWVRATRVCQLLSL